MPERKRTARVSGLWYLAMAICGPIGLVYVPSKIIVAGNAQATAANLLEHESLVRIGIFSGLLCQLIFIFLMLSLNRLFDGVSPVHSKLMSALVIAAVPVAFLNELVQLAALESKSADLTLLLLNVHQHGTRLVGFFWGLWLWPFGMLVIRSQFIPKILGVLLLVGCCAYVLDSSVALLWPSAEALAGNLFALPISIGEISMVLWLLIKGTR